ncbi:MAG: SH3 domain-containing protein, partial [Chloroflexota bacterium]
PTPTATATPVPDASQIMLVANTDGLGVYIRRTPNPNDKINAYQDGTKMEVIGQAVESAGQKWYKVRAPDGIEGYIPAQFLVDAP